jgi:lysophospholipase L1-like esterase
MLRNYYLSYDRTVVQLSPTCAQYDPSLFYRLRPGLCETREREFAVRYSVNSAGLRDTEQALRRPEMIVLGDSITMGWGVAQELTYPKRIERGWGHKVLDAGISSYATAREGILLGQLDTSALTHVVVQYCSNDVSENELAIASSFRLPISSRQRYDEVAASDRGKRRYVPGRRLLQFLRSVRSPAPLDVEAGDRSAGEQASIFLECLSEYVARPHPGVKILAFEANSYALNRTGFPAEVEKRKRDPRYPENVRNMLVEDLSTRLTADRYFDLDDHPRASGHEVIAEAVLARLRAGW